MDLNKFELFVRSQFKAFGSEFQSMYTKQEYCDLEKMWEYSISEFNNFYRDQEERKMAEEKREFLRKKLRNKLNELKEQRKSKK